MEWQLGISLSERRVLRCVDFPPLTHKTHVDLVGFSYKTKQNTLRRHSNSGNSHLLKVDPVYLGLQLRSALINLVKSLRII
jgi:hypothetical protein